MSDCPNPKHGGNHCLHYQEGDGDCCICEAGLTHCDSCGWAGEPNEPGNGCNEDGCDCETLCPECNGVVCRSHANCLDDLQ